MLAEKAPYGIGRQMNNGLACRLLHRGPLRAQRQSCQQRTAAADGGAQIGDIEGCDNVITGNQKSFGSVRGNAAASTWECCSRGIESIAHTLK